MGSFYTSVALRGVSQDQVRRVLSQMRRRAFVSPARRNIIAVYDAKCEKQDTKDLSELALALSRELRCVAWGVLNHDDDVLWYVLCSNGEYMDSYNSAPDYFHEEASAEPAPPEGGDAEVLARLLNKGKSVRQIAAILRKSDSDEGGYTFAMDRHRALAETLGVPFEVVSIGYEMITGGELPEGMDKAEMARVGK